MLSSISLHSFTLAFFPSDVSILATYSLLSVPTTISINLQVYSLILNTLFFKLSISSSTVAKFFCPLCSLSFLSIPQVNSKCEILLPFLIDLYFKLKYSVFFSISSIAGFITLYFKSKICLYSSSAIPIKVLNSSVSTFHFWKDFLCSSCSWSATE